MIKLFKRFKPLDWVLFIVLVGFVIGQVYFDLELPSYTSKIVNEIYNPEATTNSILMIGLQMLLLALGSMGCTIVVGFIAAILSSGLSSNLRHAVFSKVESFSFEEIGKFSTPSLITRSTNDIQQVQQAVMMILRMAISAPITAVWAIMKINASSGELTIATAVAIVLLITALIAIFLVVLPKFKIAQKLTDKLNGVTRENLTGLRVVKAYNAEKYQEEKFSDVNKKVTKTNLFINRIMGLVNPLMMLVMNGITLTIYWLGAYLINQGNLDMGTMSSFSMLAMQVLMSFMMLTMLFIMVPRASVSANRINQILDTKLTIVDPEVEEVTITEGEVEFSHVSFKYPDASSYVLEDINFKVEKGQTVAFIGSTGSGKSTLINLVPRFYDASEGEILIDGVNVKNLKQKTLRKKIGYVPQKGVLFSGTVNENIAYGDSTISKEKIVEACKVASADRFINEMEQGYESHISQGGKNVSGGQKQRLSIARAVAIDPEIYIFDDSFSALDYKTDKEVRSALKEYTKDATSLIVAQRIGTIKNADLIIVLDKGKMVGKGTHEDLLRNCSVYREIALSQLSKEELGL